MSLPNSSSFRNGNPGTPIHQKPPSYQELQRLHSSDSGVAPPRSDPSSEVRTRDGRHSPYTAKVIDSPSFAQQQQQQQSPPPQVSYPMQHLAARGGSGPASPTAAAPAAPGPSLPPSYEEAYGRAAVHTSLSGRCAFVPIPLDVPPYRELPVEDPSTLPPPLFLGQLRFETTASEIRFLLQELSGVEPLRIEPRGHGCMHLVLRQPSDRHAVMGLRQRVLFDQCGVWVANSPDEVYAIGEYLRSRNVPRRTRLPRDTMVIEEPRVLLPPPAAAAAPPSLGQPMSNGALQQLDDITAAMGNNFHPAQLGTEHPHHYHHHHHHHHHTNNFYHNGALNYARGHPNGPSPSGGIGGGGSRYQQHGGHHHNSFQQQLSFHRPRGGGQYHGHHHHHHGGGGGGWGAAGQQSLPFYHDPTLLFHHHHQHQQHFTIADTKNNSTTSSTNSGSNNNTSMGGGSSGRGGATFGLPSPPPPPSSYHAEHTHKPVQSQVTQPYQVGNVPPGYGTRH